MEAQRKPGPTPAERRLWGRRGALIMHGLGRTNVGPAHAALAAKWLRLADPDGTLPPEVRERRAAQLRRAHMLSMSSRAAEARRNKRAGPDRDSGPAQPREGTTNARRPAA
jgi:hypothetical protein